MPATRAIIDQELIKRRVKKEHRNRMNILRAAEKETLRNVFQKLGGDSQPKNLSEVFRNYEASEEVEDTEPKVPRWIDMRSSHPGYAGRDVRVKGRIENHVTKKNLACLGRRWYIVGNDGRHVKEIGASMIRRVQRQHKAHMDSLRVPITSETSKNVKPEKTPHEGRNQPHWRSKREVKKANGKNEGKWDHVPSNPHPGKYRILRKAQEDTVMMPTPRWSPEPICFGIISPERGLPAPLLMNDICEAPEQMPNFGITHEEGLSELMLPEEAHAWLDEFMNNIEGKKKDLPRPSNFHVNMTYVYWP